MSFKWVNHILEERRDLKGAELLCAIVVANYASTDDRCYPGMEKIAADMRCSVRHVQGILRRLEKRKVFRIEPGDGRGHKTSFQLIKDEQLFTVPSSERVNDPAPLPNEKGRTIVQIKGEQLRTERVNNCAHPPTPPYKDEPLREPKKNQERENTPARNFAPPRVDQKKLKANHPALVAVRKQTGMQPDSATWDGLIDILGFEPDELKLAACYKAWMMKGFRKTNYGWVTDWYLNGIPQDRKENRVNSNGTNTRTNGYHKRTDADVIAESADFYDNYPS